MDLEPEYTVSKEDSLEELDEGGYARGKEIGEEGSLYAVVILFYFLGRF